MPLLSPNKEFVKHVLLKDREYVELTLEITKEKNKGFHGKYEQIKKDYQLGRARPDQVAYIELIDRWVTRLLKVTAEHFDVCFKKSPSLNNK